MSPFRDIMGLVILVTQSLQWSFQHASIVNSVGLSYSERQIFNNYLKPSEEVKMSRVILGIHAQEIVGERRQRIRGNMENQGKNSQKKGKSRKS